jgi:hypothetical protein
LDLKVVQVLKVLKEVLDQQEDKVLKEVQELVLVLKVLPEDKALKVLTDCRRKVLKGLKV